MATQNREEYLNRGAELIINKVMVPAGFDVNASTGDPLIDRLRVACGWPTNRATSKNLRAVGQCFDPSVSASGYTEIFISPFLSEASEVLPALVHEIVHAAVGTNEKHGKAFKQACLMIGLDGKATQTIPNDALTKTLVAISAELGEYPHAKMDVTTLPKQTTRLLSAVCPNANCATFNGGDVYKVRITQRWVMSFPNLVTPEATEFTPTSLPYCGCCGTRMVLEPSKSKSGEGEPKKGEPSDEDGPNEGDEGEPTQEGKENEDSELDPDSETEKEIEEMERMSGDDEEDDEEDEDDDFDAEVAKLFETNEPPKESGAHKLDMTCQCERCVAEREALGI